MRKLASIRTITDIQPIPKADKVEAVYIDGWCVVCKKDEYKINDLCIYIEIDSFVPHEIAPFLTQKDTPRVYHGVSGNRVRSKKIRGVLSQGLVLPLDEYTAMCASAGDDMTETLGILLWEPTIPVQLRGKMKGSFPTFIPKTDQERIQNIDKETYDTMIQSGQYEVTEKLDGSSMTIYKWKGVIGVCSRNVELKVEDENTFCNMYRKLPIPEEYLEGFAIQGELIGPGIQGNQYGLTDSEFYVYDVFDISKQCYVSPEKVVDFCIHTGLKHVPVLDYITLPENSRDLLSDSDGASKLNNSNREGVVLKSMVNQSSFKVVSNAWLTMYE